MISKLFTLSLILLFALTPFSKSEVIKENEKTFSITLDNGNQLEYPYVSKSNLKITNVNKSYFGGGCHKGTASVFQNEEGCWFYYNWTFKTMMSISEQTANALCASFLTECDE